MLTWSGDDSRYDDQLLRQRYSSYPLRRPGSSADDFDLFGSTNDHEDMKQGQVGNCWFCAAMQVVAKAGHIEENFLNRGASNAGIYGTRFYPLGVPVDMMIDDRLFFRGSSSDPLFARKGDSGEYWPALLEKGFAKLHGNYARTAGGDPSRGVSYLNGSPSEYLWKQGNSQD